VTISSDAPVAEPRPLEAIQASVTRVTRRGHKLGPDDLVIDVRTALRGHTIEAARSIGREDDLGTLEVGKRADFAVLAADVDEVDPETIGEIAVLQTWIDGTRRHVAATAETEN
jgi:predicted amidohydrolase YtcJ